VLRDSPGSNGESYYVYQEGCDDLKKKHVTIKAILHFRWKNGQCGEREREVGILNWYGCHRWK